MSNYNLTKMATQMFFPGNVAQVDDAGLPSILVFIPAFKNSDVLNGGDDSTHPAFIVNGKEVSGFYYSKYQNVVHNGAAYSLPAEDPQTSVNFDTALALCEAKGAGWHLSTAAEWAAIALWCKKNGFLPYGNNAYGKDNRESEYKAIPTAYGSDGKINRVAAGTGPVTWSHDNTMAGIWDMNGNLWEWQCGLRLVWGELQILANNDAADSENPQNAKSTGWKAINAADGSLVEPESKTTDTAVKTAGRTIKIDFINEVWTFSTGITNVITSSKSCPFIDVVCTADISEAAKGLLRALALLPDTGATSDDYEGDGMWWNNGLSERVIFRGGHHYYGAPSGVFSINGGDGRTTANQLIGFRAAYIPEIGE